MEGSSVLNNSSKRKKKLFRNVGFKGFNLFERCSGGILNLRYDSDILESFYAKCSYPSIRARCRFKTAYITFLSLVWLIFFSLLQPSSWTTYVCGLCISTFVSLIYFCISFSDRILSNYALWISGSYIFVCSVLVLFTFIPTEPGITLAFNLSIVLHLIFVSYVMAPLKLWQLLTVCGPLSVIQILLACFDYDRVNMLIATIIVVGHLCVHLIGINLHLMSQVWRRSTFLHLGYNALMRKALKKEQELRDDMIRSLMPNQVAQEVMKEVCNEGDAEGSKKHGKRREGKKKKSNQEHLKTSDLNNFDFNDEDFKPDGSSCLGDGDDSDFDDYNASKKKSISSNAEDAKSLDEVEAGKCPSPRTSLIPKSNAMSSPRAVAFRKFHVNQLENVSVLFADIVGFTKMSSNKSASHLVYLLNDLFGRFDRLCEIVGCEKIATLGDCYYCVSGCPNAVSDHAERTVEMGRSMCLAIQQFDEDHQEEVNMRVGVHTGKVICGIVGTKRFKFDVWSNDVTLANEMESSGEAGKVHVSEATLSFVKDIYEVSEGKPVQDIRKFKVLVEFFNKEEQCFAIKHTQDESMIKTYFIERRLDNKPVYSLPPMETMEKSPTDQSTGSTHPTDSQSAVSHPLMSTTTNSFISPNLSDVEHDTDGRQVTKSVSDAFGAHRLSIEKTSDSTKSKVTNRGSDVEMLEALQDLAQPDQVFVFPPISRFTLNFFSPSVENSFRFLGLRRPLGRGSTKLTCSSPRVAPFINLITEAIILVALWITCLVAFPDTVRVVTWPGLYIATIVAFVIHALLLTLIVLDLIIWVRYPPKNKGGNAIRDWRYFVIHLYGKLFQWRLRNIIGTIVLTLPTCLVLASFSGCMFASHSSVAEGNQLHSVDPILAANYRTLIGLLFSFMFLNCTLFTSFSSWTKSLSAWIVCICGLLLISLSYWSYSPCGTNHIEIWRMAILPPTANHSTIFPRWAQSAQQPENVIWEFVVILLVTLILVCLLNREFDINFRLSFHRDFEALQAKNAISRQKLQAEWLLENIIPYYIMDDLRKHSKYSQHIKDAGVLFACISNFSEFYDEQYQGGQEMLRVLNEIFADFEHLLALPKYKDVEKIKTIGACFMAASGLNMIERRRNVRPEEHLWALLDFAQDLIHTLDDFNKQMFNFRFELKVGFNIGEVTAGVIGTTKLLYDIWGDTVNVASRMYSTGTAGRIQAAEFVTERLASRYTFEYRGDVHVKGKGNMRTFFFKGRRSDSSLTSTTTNKSTAVDN